MRKQSNIASKMISVLTVFLLLFTFLADSIYHLVETEHEAHCETVGTHADSPEHHQDCDICSFHFSHANDIVASESIFNTETFTEKVQDAYSEPYLIPHYSSVSLRGPPSKLV